jgi:glycosyltransferase involved in cell wall biosynthesis
VITVVTPTIPGREDLLAECIESVAMLGLAHLVQLDADGAGPAAVRNRLAAEVRTEWTLFLDDDDLLYPNYLGTVLPYLPAADVVYTAWDLTGATDPQPEPFFDEIVLRHHNVIPVTACVRTDMFRAVGGFPLGEDLEDYRLWLKLLDAGARFANIPVIAWHYRRLAGSRTEAVA